MSQRSGAYSARTKALPSVFQPLLSYQLPAAVDEMKLGGERRPPMPYRDARLLGALQHTLWFLPGVAACDAMENLLAERQNSFYRDYSVANCSRA